MYFIDTVAQTVDKTKTVAASAVDTSLSYAGAAKGSKNIYELDSTSIYSLFLLFLLLLL